MPDNVPLVVTQEEPSREPGAGMLPQRLGRQVTSILEVDGNELAASLASVVAQLHEIANEIPQTSENYEVEYLDFSLGISKNGKVGIMSAVDLARGTQATISIRLKRK